MTVRIPIEDLVKGQYFLTNSHWYFAAARPIYGEDVVRVGVIDPMRGDYGEVDVYDRVIEVAGEGQVPKPFQPESLERRAKAADARVLKEQRNAERLRGVQARIAEITQGVKA